jgi:hypothetical protein
MQTLTHEHEAVHKPFTAGSRQCTAQQQVLYSQWVGLLGCGTKSQIYTEFCRFLSGTAMIGKQPPSNPNHASVFLLWTFQILFSGGIMLCGHRANVRSLNPSHNTITNSLRANGAGVVVPVCAECVESSATVQVQAFQCIHSSQPQN